MKHLSKFNKTVCSYLFKITADIMLPILLLKLHCSKESHVISICKRVW